MDKNKVVFLDRDGTINKDYGYVHSIDKLEFLDYAIEGLKKISDLGYKLVIVTNQSGIGRKYFSEEEYLKFNNIFLNRLSEKGINIEKVYYCPHIDEDNCNCRKPKTGMFHQAIKELNIDTDKSFAIGDSIRDLSICEETNVKGILLNNNSSKYKNCDNLLEAANYILSINC